MLSVLTLQFIPVNYRQRIVQEIHDVLHPDGAFILVEKVIGEGLDERMIDLYHARKHAAGYSYESIDRKRESLEGVLVPNTARQNTEMLERAGFRFVDCFWRWIASAPGSHSSSSRGQHRPPTATNPPDVRCANRSPNPASASSAWSSATVRCLPPQVDIVQWEERGLEWPGALLVPHQLVQHHRSATAGGEVLAAAIEHGSHVVVTEDVHQVAEEEHVAPQHVPRRGQHVHRRQLDRAVAGLVDEPVEVAERLGQIGHDDAGVGMATGERHRERAGAATDVDHRRGIVEDREAGRNGAGPEVAIVLVLEPGEATEPHSSSSASAPRIVAMPRRLTRRAMSRTRSDTLGPALDEVSTNAGGSGRGVRAKVSEAPMKYGLPGAR